MHDTDEDLYSWPTCTACQKDLWVDEAEAGRLACRPCENRTAKRLTELPALFAELNRTATLMRGARRTGTATSGSRTPPIPPRIEVLALTGPGGIAARLTAIEDSWRQALGWAIPVRHDHVRTFAGWRLDPARDVPERARFLANNLLWACSSYDSISQDIDDIRRLHTEATTAISTERRPGPVKVGRCPAPTESGACDTQLTANSGKEHICCGACGTQWFGKEGWDDLRNAQQEILQRDAGVAA
ncbi:hypothetical protein AB0M57_04625 [Streptomyces sp. NPDC051597]|uniref:hypothetical protein n=1 Tax=Streptomyces sp. NPDC051597 TaxID=3155049 RepID=UPI003444BA42